MKAIASIEDLKARTRRRIPSALFGYVESGAYEQHTLSANAADLDALGLRQRVLVDISERDLSTTVLGQPIAMPFGLAPTGLTGLVHPDGEIHACRAAQARDIPFVLSTMSICSIEDVAAAVDRPFWFQLYVMQDRAFTADLIARAKAAGCSALVLTVDLQVQGRRYHDIRNGMTAPPRLTAKNAFDILTKPRWALGVMGGKRRDFGNLAGRVADATGMRSMAEWTARQYDPTLNWGDVDWVRAQWDGPLIIKGLIDAEDAEKAAAIGVDGIIVSNHGGRQLDGAASTARALPSVVDRVSDRVEVYVDGGVRTGLDILKFLALGARCVFVGRAFLYGLGAGGRAGVDTSLEILEQGLSVGMALTGRRRIEDLSREILLDSRHAP